MAVMFLLSSVTLKEWSVLAAVVVVASLLYFIAKKTSVRSMELQ